MRKKFGLITPILLLILLLIPLSSVNAYPGGLANGKPGTITYGTFSGGETTLLATDDNNKTSVSLKSQTLVIDLGETHTINSYRLDATGTFRWKLYNDNKTYIGGFETSAYPMNGNPFVGHASGVRYLVMDGTGTINELDVFTGSILPSAPQNLVAVGGDSKVTLNWDAVTDAKTYTVKRSTTLGGPYTNISVSIKDTSFIDTSVTNGLPYYYVVSAISDGGESPNSKEASATSIGVVTPDPSTKPDPSTTPDPSTKPDPSTTPDPSTKPDPSDTDGTSQPTGDRAILTVTMDNGFDKEFDLSKKELNAFIAWYDAKDAGRGASFFAIDKHNNNKGPFSNRKDYVIFNKILTFEVSEYSTK
ncbi:MULTISPECIES: hypothetical protein [unclassified Paenibacillus]|uniref:hypothetical protein n=1 Tax=unclassified Paenibacillus TaxID=185978 RepID=UPI0038377555